MTVRSSLCDEKISMHFLTAITLILIGLSIPQAQSSICGLYQVEDFGDRVLYSITHFREDYSRQIIYSVTNPATVPVHRMMNGYCYCVDGPVMPDPEFYGDSGYKLISIESIDTGPLLLPPLECSKTERSSAPFLRQVP